MRRFAPALLALAGGCSSAELPDCPMGTTIANGICRTQCQSDDECAVNEECFENVCTLPVGSSDAGSTDVGIIACTKDTECPNGRSGPFSDCAYDDACNKQGSRSRLIRRGKCADGFCSVVESTQNMACPRETDGMTCGEPVGGMFGSCENEMDECSTMGVQSRTVDTPTCMNSVCAPVTGTEQQPCARNTDSLSCGPGMVTGPWSMCSFPDVCSSRGARSRTIDTYKCSNSSCMPSTATELDLMFCVQPAPTDGTDCGMGQQCCSGVCTAKDDPQNCNVCGYRCGANAMCTSFLAGDSTQQYACSCGEHTDCLLNYGPSAGCVPTPQGNNICVCDCPFNDCTAQCDAPGTCYQTNGLNYCAY